MLPFDCRNQSPFCYAMPIRSGVKPFTIRPVVDVIKLFWRKSRFPQN